MYYIPYSGYISPHKNLRVLNIQRLKFSDKQPTCNTTVYSLITFHCFNFCTRGENLKHAKYTRYTVYHITMLPPLQCLCFLIHSVYEVIPGH